jgi:serine/threonine-protein kinase
VNDLPRRIGRYEVLGELAKGKTAHILLGRAQGPNEFEHRVAIKWMQASLAESPRHRRRFAFEAAITGRLTHPSLVPAIDAGSSMRRPFMVLEYVGGWSLRALWATAALTRTPIPLDVAISIVHGAAGGLHAAHELRDPDGAPVGLVHRNVSPFNLLVGENGFTRVLDFGFATTAAKQRETRRARVGGTSRYLPPEVLEGELVDRRGDVFSLGVVLYELTTGRHYAADASPPSGGDYPALLESIVTRALTRDPASRHPSAEVLQLALETTSARLGFPISAPRVGQFVRGLFAAHDRAPTPEQEPAAERPARRADSEEITRLHSLPRHTA